jgi:hypothetical protein
MMQRRDCSNEVEVPCEKDSVIGSDRITWWPTVQGRAILGDMGSPTPLKSIRRPLFAEEIAYGPIETLDAASWS